MRKLDDFTRKIKSDTVSTVSSSISHKVMGPDAMVFVFLCVYQSAEWALVKRLTGTDLVVDQALNDHQSSK